MTRWLFLFLAVVAGWFSPANAHALTRVGQAAYDGGAALEKVVFVAGITMDTFEGTQTDPLGLHKYLYVADNPVNLNDPTGHDFDIISFTAASAINGAIAGGTFGSISAAYSYAKGATAGAALMQGLQVAALTEFSFVSPLAAVSLGAGGVATLGLGIYSGNVTVNDIPEIGTYLLAAVVLHTAISPAGAGAVADANFAQPRGGSTFSAPGKAVLSKVAGTTINTTDDLAAQLRSGSLKPSQVPVDYVVVQGQKVILNTRTSIALNKAGIPKAQWYGRNVTGVKVPGMAGKTFDDLCNMQTENNCLPPKGTPNMPQ